MQCIRAAARPVRTLALQLPGAYSLVARQHSTRRRLPVLGVQCSNVHQVERQKFSQDSLLVLLLAAPAASHAAEPALDTTKVVKEAAASTPGGPNAFGLAVLFSPLLLYGIFSLYRERVNPQAKLSNFAVIIGALLLAANLFSIIVYKVRFF